MTPRLASCLVVLVVACGGDAAGRVPADTRYALYRDGIPVGTETASITERVATFTTDARIGPGVQLRARIETDGRGAPISLEITGSNLPWFPAPASWRRSAPFSIASPLPIAVMATFARHTGASVEDCSPHMGLGGLRCVEIGGVAWGRSFVWIDSSGALAAAFVPTVLGKVQALRSDVEQQRDTFLALAARSIERIGTRARPIASSDAGLLVRGANVIDVISGRVTPDADLVVRGGRIAGIGPRGTAGALATERVLDASGMWIIPGLWDMHAHMRHADWAPAYLAAGVTTVRDVGNHLTFVTELRRQLARDSAPGPRLVLAGWVDATDASPYPYRASDSAQARELVRRYDEAGFEQIKVWENLPRSLLPVVTAEAHRRGMTVTGHVPDGMTLLQALDAGLDHLNHIDFVTEAVAWNVDSARSVDRLIAALRRRGTVIDATLLIPEFRGRELHRPLGALEPGAAHVPPDMVAANQLLRGNPRDSLAGGRNYRRALYLVNRLHRAGVPIVAGTDQSIPGYSLLHELELYVLAGLQPIDALRAATIVPARAMRRDSAVGSLDRGKLADFVVLDGDPLADISAIRRARWVVRGGVVFDAAALRRAAGLR